MLEVKCGCGLVVLCHGVLTSRKRINPDPRVSSISGFLLRLGDSSVSGYDNKLHQRAKRKDILTEMRKLSLLTYKLFLVNVHERFQQSRIQCIVVTQV